MKARILPEDIAREIVKIIEKRCSYELVSGDGLFYIPRELFGTEREVTKLNGDLTIDGWLVPPYLIDEIYE